MTGEFQALDAETGKLLWSFQTPSGIVGQPVTWERNGKQYVTVMSGIGGVYALFEPAIRISSMCRQARRSGRSLCSTSDPFPGGPGEGPPARLMLTCFVHAASVSHHWQMPLAQGALRRSEATGSK